MERRSDIFVIIVEFKNHFQPYRITVKRSNMRKGYKKHHVTCTWNNAAEGCRSIITTHIADVQCWRWTGYWDGYQFSEATFYCSNEDFERIKKYCSEIGGLAVY